MASDRPIAASPCRVDHVLVAVVIPAIVFAVLGMYAFATQREQESNDDEPQLTVRVPDEASGMYNIPPRPRIRSIEAEAFGMSTVLSAKLPDIPPFAIPASHWEAILQHLENPRVDLQPHLGWPPVGRVKITRDDGEVMDITYYWDKSKQRLHYSVRGVRCYDGRGGPDSGMRDDAMLLDYQLREAYRSVTGHITTEPLVNTGAERGQGVPG